MCIPRAYFHKYLAQNPTYSRQTKARVMYEPRPLRVYRYHAVWLRFDSADTRNLVILRRCVYPRAYFHKYLAQNPTYSRQTKAHVMYEPRPLRVYRFHAVRLCFELCRHEESRHSPEVCIPRAYFHEYLAQNPTYSRQTKAHVMYGSWPLRVYRYHAVWLRFDSADTRNLVIVRRCVYPEPTFTNISLKTQPTRAKPKPM